MWGFIKDDTALNFNQVLLPDWGIRSQYLGNVCYYNPLDSFLRIKSWTWNTKTWRAKFAADMHFT